MKVIIIYSGKGGVGKTTTTANIARTLAKQKQKVFILDADVNTPSMPVIFPEPDSVKNIKVASLGYSTHSQIYVTNSAVRSYISDCINSVAKYNPDYVLIDTPPSITDVHINLIDKIKPSGLIIVTQPNTLSTTDVNRTSMFFKDRGVNIIGVVENMVVNDSKNTYSWKILTSIPFEKDFNFDNVLKNNEECYKQIVESLQDIDSVILENKIRQIFDESITVEDVESLPYEEMNDLRFINIQTWDYVRDLLQERESSFYPDRALDELTTERIERMVKVFEKDERGYFMVTKAPSCEIQLLPGEIGEGVLDIKESHYGVPRIKYSTSQGDITLFPYEVKPVTNEEILGSLERGYLSTKDGRYLPPKDELYEVEAAFGRRVGMPRNWEELYDNILNNSLPSVEVHVASQELSKTKGTRKYRKTMTIRDLNYKLRHK